MEFSLILRKLHKIEPKRLIFVIGIIAITHLLCQSVMLPYGTALKSLMADSKVTFHGKKYFLAGHSSEKSIMVGKSYNGDVGQEPRDDVGALRIKKNVENSFLELVEDEDTVDDSRFDNNNFDVEETLDFEDLKDHENSSIPETIIKTRHGLSLDQVVKANGEISADNFRVVDTSKDTDFKPPSLTFSPVASSINSTILKTFAASKNNSAIPVKKKMRCDMPPKSVMLIDEMNRLHIKHRRSSRSVKPRWSSVRDQEILIARSQILNAATTTNDPELYPPLFRNVSMFKRSYELMESVLKVYVYKDGKKPIFHQPILKGLYASEGWFMKLMEGNKQFLVKDPQKAHLFYMPFSSRMMQYSLYVRNSHNRTNLVQFLKGYVDSISTKYPFFKRTDGSDHFLVACHDWAPYETRHHMERCIKALCNADVAQGFKIGRDVSLPETYVRSAKDPQRDLGGKPASERNILAFYAGNMHGYLRTILLNHWKDKDPDMKIFGPMPRGVASKMNYIQHMKSSRYCICPKGYEVNSPRVVESIFYECVPVIISDNFVPSFFDVLDWGAFSVILAEKDIPNLKKILASIPEKKYLEMQLAVKRVQRHFLWHEKPIKYDLFHMTLHSIWLNRVFQIKVK